MRSMGMVSPTYVDEVDDCVLCRTILRRSNGLFFRLFIAALTTASFALLNEYKFYLEQKGIALYDFTNKREVVAIKLWFVDKKIF